MALNVLLVDDSDTTRRIITKALKMAQTPIGELHEAVNGEEALELLSRHWVDLVFADINMPVMDGVELVKRLKQDELLENLPVIIVSTEGSAQRISLLNELGVRAFIRKPFTPEMLQEVVNDVMGEKHG